MKRPPHACHVLELAFLACALSLGGIAAREASGQEAVVEHLPRSSKPPAPGVRPAGLPAYATRLGLPAVSDADRRFDRLVDEFLLAYFRTQPVRATAAGIHDYDALFPATDSASIDSALAGLERLGDRFGELELNRLGPERRVDHGVVMRRIRDLSFEVRDARTWRRDPAFYLRIISEGVRLLVGSDFAPLEDRTWNVIARLTRVPGMLRDARSNLDAPDRAKTAAAIVEAAELAEFLANELPVKVAPLRDPVLGEEFDHHLAPAVGAVAEYRHWLKTVVVSRGAPATALDSLLWR